MMRAGIVAIVLVTLFYIVASGLALFAVTRDKNKPAVIRIQALGTFHYTSPSLQSLKN